MSWVSGRSEESARSEQHLAFIARDTERSRGGYDTRQDTSHTGRKQTGELSVWNAALVTLTCSAMLHNHTTHSPSDTHIIIIAAPSL